MRTGLLALAALIALVGTAFASRAPQLDLADFSYAVTAAGHLNKTAVCVARDGDAAHGWRMAGLGSYQGFDWSLNGSRFAVAFSRRSTGPILTAEADPSAGFRALTSPRLATEDDSAPKWSPDSRAVAFARYIFFGPHVDYRRFGMWLVDVRTGRERHLSRRFPTAIAWSPDGQHLAVRFHEDLSLFAASGRLEWTISRGEGSSGEIAWSPSGDLLAARFGREVLLLTPQRTPVARITRPDTELGSLEVGLGWSPDGRQLALGGGEVYDRSGAPTGRYAAATSWEAVAFAPTWSPEGTAVVFERARPTRVVWRYGSDLQTLAADLYATRMPGGEPTALTTTAGIDEEGVVFRPARVSGTAGTARACMRVGTPGRDVIYGIRQDEFISTGADDDVLIGRSGSDLLLAGDGNDVVRAGGGRDEVVGGRGNDRFYARDRRADLISGGPGFDRAWVDRRDRVSAVERVYRVGRR